MVGLTLTQMALVNPSEVEAEFPLSAGATSDALWDLATAHEWSLMAPSEDDVCREENPLFPFLVANGTPGQRPYQRRRPVEDRFAEASVGRSVHSDDSISAFLLHSSMVAAASAASPPLFVQPVPPCAKIAPGLIDAASGRSEAVLHLTLCGGRPGTDVLRGIRSALRRAPSELRRDFFWTGLGADVDAILGGRGGADAPALERISRRREAYRSALTDGVRTATVSDVRRGDYYKGMSGRRDATIIVVAAPDGPKSMVALIVAAATLPVVSRVFATPRFDFGLNYGIGHSSDCAFMRSQSSGAALLSDPSIPQTWSAGTVQQSDPYSTQSKSSVTAQHPS